MANFMSNFMPGEWDLMNKTPDIMPTDDASAQLMLKRRLAQADLLKGMEAPQGQMVSGHYVAPSWTQYLANAVNKYQGRKQEEQAMQDYSQAQATKAQKLGDLMKGKTQFVTDEQGNQRETTVPYSNEELIGQLAGIDSSYAPKLFENYLANRQKTKQPFDLAAGATRWDYDANGNLIKVAENPKEETGPFGKINPSDFTPASLAKYSQSRKYEDLVPVAKQQTETNVGKLMAEMNALPPNDPRRAFYQQAIRKETTVPQDFTQQTFKYNQARGLREDFAGLPEVKAWNVIQPTLVAARQAAKDTSGGSDLNLIYAMGKIMDPNSVVREGELQMAGDTGSLGQKIMGYYKSVAKGGKLPPKVKDDLLAQIESRAKAQESLYKNTKAKYTDIAKRNQINPEDLFVEGITSPSNAVDFNSLR